MAFSRKQMVAAVAGTLSLAVLTGCPAATAPTPPTTSTPASAAPSAPASVAPPASTAPTTAPSTEPGATTEPGASPTTNASAPPPSGKLVIVSGNVYNEEGATVNDAVITVKSLDTSVPYEATATTNAGSWVVNNVPEGANVEIVASKDGWTSRRRVGSFQQQATGRRNVINFGAAGGSAGTNDDDATGEAYFISDYPEITATTPVHEATGVEANTVSYKLTFSEPLSVDSRANFDDVFHILPANRYAANSTTGFVTNEATLDFDRGEDNLSNDGIGATADTLAEFVDLGGVTGGADTYSLGEGDTFLGSSSNRMRGTWNEAGTEVTYTLNAGLLTDDNNAAKYQAVLVVDNAADELRDMNNKNLGTNKDGGHTSFEAAGGFIYNAFKELDLSADHEQKNSASAAIAKGLANWASTHSTVSTFELIEDDTDPVLTAVDVTDEDNDLRIAMTFSEPMAAYGGNGAGITHASVTTTTNYTFMLGEKTGDIKDDQLDDVARSLGVTAGAAVYDDTLKIEAATQVNGYGKEFDFGTTPKATARVEAGLSADGGAADIFIEVDKDDPKVVLFWIENGKDAFSNVDELGVRAEGVADPAGNAIRDQEADTQVKVAKV